MTGSWLAGLFVLLPSGLRQSVQPRGLRVAADLRSGRRSIRRAGPTNPQADRPAVLPPGAESWRPEQAVAAALHLSTGTVRNHPSIAIQKLNAQPSRSSPYRARERLAL